MPEYALSVRQPWAWLIVHGFKGWENRQWGPQNPARRFLEARLPFTFSIHASGTMSRREYEEAARVAWDQAIRIEGPILLGGIVGVATAVAWRDEEDALDRFSFGPGIVLRDARPLPFVRCKGSLGFFRPMTQKPNHPIDLFSPR
jgi:hypothetical protein